jgi:hypothetical protein
MPDLSETPATHDQYSALTADSPLTAEELTEVTVTETVEAIAQSIDVPGAPAAVPRPPASPTSAASAAQLALHTGWTMAVLHASSQAPEVSGLQHLPTVHELPPRERAEVELRRLAHLLTRLAQLPEFAGSGIPTTVPAWNASEAELQALNLAILEALAAAGPEAEQAYNLGRSLRDTARPPQSRNDASAQADAQARALAHGRVTKLQGWLATLSAQFPQHTADIVAQSLGRWSDFASATIAPGTKTRLRNKDRFAAAAAMQDYLFPQGDLWLLLLTGARSTAGLLSPEGYVAAGEAALGRSARIARQIIGHYWVAWLIGAIALGGLLYLAIRYLGGAAKVWTSIATIGGTLGISARSIASTAGRLTAEAERPVFAMAEEDVMAWAITTLPQVRLTPRGIRQLRRAGIAPSSSLGRV